MASTLYLGDRYVKCNVALAQAKEQDKNKKEQNVIYRNEPRAPPPLAGRAGVAGYLQFTGFGPLPARAHDEPARPAGGR